MPEAVEENEKPVVMIVDDDETIRLLGAQALSLSDLETIEAADGREAIQIFGMRDIDMILLDVDMPECDGFEVIRTVRADTAGRDVPIIMMTGQDDPGQIARAYELGATDFITKPVNWMILRQRTNYVLRASQVSDELRRSQERLEQAQSVARLGTWELELDSGRLQHSSEFARIFGHPPDRGPLGVRRALVRILREDREKVIEAISRAFIDHRSFDLEFRIESVAGGRRVISSHVSVHVDDRSSRPRLIGTAQDITERTEAQDRIRYLAFHDSLTGVENQTMFRERLAAALDQAQRHGRSMALLFIDLDSFKRINDTMGHAAGDAVLQAVADRLAASIRASDAVGRPAEADMMGSVARLGGDEFTVLLSEIADAHDAALVARRFLEKLRVPIDFVGRKIVFSASIGIAVATEDGTEADVLLRNADAAMYHAKELGGANYQFYRSAMNADSVKRLKIEVDLGRALENEQVEAYFQPRVCVESGKIVGAEALARWKDLDAGMISPGVFIPVAEECGLILELGRVMLSSALKHVCAWHELGFEDLLVSVNLSPKQLCSPDIAKQTLELVGECGIDPALVELEITETALIQNEELAGRALRELKDAGLRIAFDDFGTGYSSMSFLKRFPVDTVKIDRSFISGIGSNAEDEAIVEGILSLSRALGLSTVAEGVETEEQLGFLEARGCDELQGYLFSRALPGRDLTLLLSEAIAGGSKKWGRGSR